jgi:probable F420-dependent oxidoreductase
MKDSKGIGPSIEMRFWIRAFNDIGTVKLMEFGVFMFATDTAIRPDQLAREVEARGFDSLWFPEHSHIPVSRQTPWGGQVGAPPLPEHYWHSLDQFVALTAAAAVTSKLKLGTGITLVAQRDPIWTAKEVATLDLLSGGRVVFGIGYGWNKEEMAQHGATYTKRRELLREKVLMMKSLWADEVSSFQGDVLSLEPSWAWPKPIQRPHPPIIMGADAGPRTIQDMVEFCEGWMPLATRMDVVDRAVLVRQALEDAGRDPSSFEITAYAAKLDNLDLLVEAGVDRAVFSLPPAGPDVVIPKLDELAAAVSLT